MKRFAKFAIFYLSALVAFFAIWASPLMFGVASDKGFIDPILPNLIGQAVTQRFTRFQDLRVGLPSEVYADETGVSFDCNHKHPPETIHLADISRCRIAFASPLASERCPFWTQGSYCTGIHVPAYFLRDGKFKSLLSEVLLRPCGVIRGLDGAETGDWYKRLSCGEEKPSTRLRLIIVEVGGETVKTVPSADERKNFYLFADVSFFGRELTGFLHLPE